MVQNSRYDKGRCSHSLPVRTKMESSSGGHSFIAAKLLRDPEINPAYRMQLYRIDGVVEGIDEYYVGEKPEKEVTFSNLNDNISYKNLEDMCKPFGMIEEAKVYYHPLTQRHLGVGTVFLLLVFLLVCF
ncbi:histone-lysine N-methyltransferase SETD1 [Clonorchis sinensis]|uniref:Histone-lysine N-methyltransferase SETD1 n=1 Tax=Clonorchis sinensis TaxID=79923 RepID=G7YH31_CLOSI|nr:histone-lysine N-methyltransferase SETD1 [Clonorchis sinensis]